jgi:hypothetical protein
MSERTRSLLLSTAALFAAAIGLTGTAQAAGPTCTPALAFKEVRFSPMQPPTMERTWTALLSVDASRCATASGPFAILFSRHMENGPEFDFEEQFTWKPGLTEVSVDFWADEAVERYWLKPASCPCRE